MFEDKILGSVGPRDVAMGPSGFGAGFSAGMSRAMSLDNSNAQRLELRERYNGLIEQYGLEVENPYGTPAGNPRSRRSRGTLDVGGRVDAFWAAVEEARQNGAEAPKREQFEAELRDEFQGIDEEAQRLYGVDTTSAVGTFAGEAVGAMRDPANIITAPIGAGAGFGLVKTAITEFVVGAAVEGVISGQRAAWYDELGMEPPDAVTAAAASGVASAALSTLPLAFRRAVRAGRMSLDYARRLQDRVSALGPEEAQRFVENAGVELQPVERMALRSAMLDTWQADALGTGAAEAAQTTSEVLDELDRAGVYAAPESAPLPAEPPAVSRVTGRGEARMDPAPVDDEGLVTAFMAQASRVESGGRADASNPNSTAFGEFQFTEGTWRDVRRDNPDLGLPADRTQASREQQRAAMRRFTEANRAELERKLGRQPTPLEMYGAHFFGRGMGPEVAAAAGDTLLRDLYGSRSAWRRVRDANNFAETMTVGAWRRRYRSKFGGEVEPAGRAPAPAASETMDARGRPRTLTSWLKRMGGLRDNDTLRGDLRMLELTRARPGLISRKGLDLDRAAQSAADAGFIRQADPDELIAAIDDEVAGRRRVVAGESLGLEMEQGDQAARTAALEAFDRSIDELDVRARDAGLEADETQIEEALEGAEVSGRDPLDVLDDIQERDAIRAIDGEVDVSDVLPHLRGGPISQDVLDAANGRATALGGRADRPTPGGGRTGGRGEGPSGALAARPDPANEDIPFFEPVQRPIEPASDEADLHVTTLLAELNDVPDDAEVPIGVRFDDNGEEVVETMRAGELRERLQGDEDFLAAMGVCARVA